MEFDTLSYYSPFVDPAKYEVAHVPFSKSERGTRRHYGFEVPKLSAVTLKNAFRAPLFVSNRSGDYPIAMAPWRPPNERVVHRARRQSEVPFESTYGPFPRRTLYPELPPRAPTFPVYQAAPRAQTPSPYYRLDKALANMGALADEEIDPDLQQLLEEYDAGTREPSQVSSRAPSQGPSIYSGRSSVRSWRTAQHPQNTPVSVRQTPQDENTIPRTASSSRSRPSSRYSMVTAQSYPALPTSPALTEAASPIDSGYGARATQISPTGISPNGLIRQPSPQQAQQQNFWGFLDPHAPGYTYARPVARRPIPVLPTIVPVEQRAQANEARADARAAIIAAEAAQDEANRLVRVANNTIARQPQNNRMRRGSTGPAGPVEFYPPPAQQDQLVAWHPPPAAAFQAPVPHYYAPPLPRGPPRYRAGSPEQIHDAQNELAAIEEQQEGTVEGSPEYDNLNAQRQQLLNQIAALAQRGIGAAAHGAYVGAQAAAEIAHRGIGAAARGIGSAATSAFQAGLNLATRQTPATSNNAIRRRAQTPAAVARRVRTPTPDVEFISAESPEVEVVPETFAQQRYREHQIRRLQAETARLASRGIVPVPPPGPPPGRAAAVPPPAPRRSGRPGLGELKHGPHSGNYVKRGSGRPRKNPKTMVMVGKSYLAGK